jgi:hypothetical protein
MQRPAPAPPGPEETRPEETEEDNLQWLPLKRSDLVFLGALAVHSEYGIYKRLRHAVKARRAQDAVIKSYACTINPILCSTTEDLKNALADKGVHEDNVASQLQEHMEAIVAEQFQDPGAYYKTFKENVTQDLTHETNAKLMKSIEQVARTKKVDKTNLEAAVDHVFSQHVSTRDYKLRP